MGQRVVLRLNEYSMNKKSFREFLDTLDVLEVGPHGKIEYMEDADGHPCLVAKIPDKAAEALEKAKRPKPPTKAQEAVRGQLQARETAVKTGAPVPGHVPAVAKGGRVLKSRRKKT